MPTRARIRSTRRTLTRTLPLASALTAGVSFAQETPDAGARGVVAAQPLEALEAGVIAQALPLREVADAGAALDVVQLAPVEVRGERNVYRPAPPSVLRLPSKPLDTPQAITAVPRKLIDEQQATTLRDAMRNVSGLTISAGEGGRQGDSFNLRGFSAQTDVFRDGVRDLGWYTRDTFNLQGVDVFFGPSSVLFGRGSTGGAINLTTRKPTARASREVSLLVGSAPSGRLSLDVNQPLTDSVQARVSGMLTYGAVAGRDGVTNFRGGVAPSLRWLVADRTTLEADYLYQRESSVPDYGHPYANGFPVSWSLGVPRTAFYGVPDEDREQVNAHVGTVRLLHRLSEVFQLANTLRVGAVNRVSSPTAPRGLVLDGADSRIGRQRFHTATDYLTVIDQLDLRGHFFTGLLEHTLNVGFEFDRETRSQRRSNLVAAGAPGGNLQTNLFTPDAWPDLSVVSPVFASANETQQTTAGVYLSEQLGLTRFVDVLLSGRLDLLDTRYVSRNAAGVISPLGREDLLFNWRLGLVLHPLERTSVYAMYGTSTNPSAEAGTLSADTQSLAAERNWTFEAGAKADLLTDRLSLTGSYFRIEKTNGRVANSDPNGAPIILSGVQRVQGLNLGLAGRIVGPWMAFANYTFMPSEIVSNPNAYLVGQPLPSTPLHAASVWTTVTPLEHLTLGGGLIFQSTTTVNNPTSEAQAQNHVPEVWRFDAYASYEFGRSTFQLNLNNVSNRLFYEASYAGQAVPAEGRVVLFTWRVRF